MSAQFLDKVVLLSSAVADADNQVMMHGRKLELLLSIEELLPKVPKAEIVSAQKKVEDLCLRTLFQNCPFILIRPIVSVLSLLFSRGSSAAMHACVAFLFQLAGHSKGESPLDRPIPGSSEEEEAPIVSVHEKSVCLSVAVGIVVNKGPSASYFVPNIVSVVHQHLKLHDPAVRESAIRSIHSAIEVMGVPGSGMGSEIFKHILYKGIYVDKSPQVKLASAYALAAFCSKCKLTASAHAESIWAVCIRILATNDHGLAGSLLVENRNAHADLLVQLLLSLITPSASPSSPVATTSSSIKSVTCFSSALGLLIRNAAKKYRAIPFAVEALTTCAVRLFIACGEKEEDLLLLAKIALDEVSNFSVSVASRMLNRLLRSGHGDSGVLRIVSEVCMPVLRLPAPGTAVPAVSEQACCVALGGLVEAMAIVESSILALDSDLSSDLIQLITSSSSVSVATNAAFTLRAFCKVCPSQAFSLVNVLLNHLTIQHAELAGMMDVVQGEGFLQVKQIMHCSLALASVMCECREQLPLDVAGAVLSTAAALIDVGEEDMLASCLGERVMWRKKFCGFTILIPILSSAGGVGAFSKKVVTLLTLWKSVLGKRTREAICAQIKPGSVIEDIASVIEPLQTVLMALTSVREFLSNFSSPEDHSDTMKLIVVFLNNAWQLVQAAKPLEQSTEDSTDGTVTTILNGIRSRLFESFLLLPRDHLDSLAKPLIVFLTSEVLQQEVRIDPASLFSNLCETRAGKKTIHNPASPPAWFSSAVCDAFEIFNSEPQFLLSNAVSHAIQVMASPTGAVPVKDYYASSLSSGSLEHYYSIYPFSHGSPFCPLIPYSGHLTDLAPLASQMTHPMLEAKFFEIRLLAKLLGEKNNSTDKLSFDACINVLISAFPRHADDDYDSPSPCLNAGSLCTVAAVAATVVLTFRSQPSSSSVSAENLLALFASQLGAAHPFVRRVSAMAIASIFTVMFHLHDSVFQLITDASVSENVRTRSATALLIGFLIQFDPNSVSIFAPNLFRLARELTLPIRTCALFSIYLACTATQSAMAPWARDVAKIATAHAVADIFPSGIVAALISGILCAFVPVANLLNRHNEGRKCFFLWHELKEVPGEEKQQRSLGAACERFAVVFASRAGNGEQAEFVMKQMERKNCYSVCCRGAIVGLTELIEQGAETRLDSRSISALFDSLLAVSDSDPPLRGDANKLLKAVLRVHGGSALEFILNAFDHHSREGIPGAAEAAEGDDEHEYDDDSENGRGKQVEDGAKTNKRRMLSLTSKGLLLKCLKRIFKSSSVSSSKILIHIDHQLDKIINVSVAAIAGESSPELSIQGIKLLCLIIEIYGAVDQKPQPQSPSGTDDDPAVPLLLQYETQIMSALRRGVRTNSDSPSTVQKLCIKALKMIVEKNLTSSGDKCIELLVQPLVIVDPLSMPWSSFFALREAGNSIMSGRSPLAQTSEKEISLILFARMQAIVDLQHLAEFRKHSPFIEYFLLRMLIDCGIAIGQIPGHKYSQSIFSFLHSDLENLIPEIKRTLIPLVLNGLASAFPLLNPLADCPSPEPVDLRALYAGICVAFASEVETACDLDALARPVWMIKDVFAEILNVFKLKFDCVKGEPLLNLLNLAGEIKEEQTVWNLTRMGIGGKFSSSLGEELVNEIGKNVIWLFSTSFFNHPEKALDLCNNVLLVLVRNHPQLVVKFLREALLHEATHLGVLLVLMDAIAAILDKSEEKNYVILLLIPVFSRLVSLASESDETLVVPSLERMRRSLVSASAAVQCVQKIISLPSPFYFVKHMFIPSVVDLMVINSQDSHHLLLPLVESISIHQRADAEEWKSLLLFVLKIALNFKHLEKSLGKCVIACMQPLPVFKETLSTLSHDEKSLVESIVRNNIPKPSSSENPDSSSTSPVQQSVQAPQIQLKLKFGQAPKV